MFYPRLILNQNVHKGNDQKTSCQHNRCHAPIKRAVQSHQGFLMLHITLSNGLVQRKGDCSPHTQLRKCQYIQYISEQSVDSHILLTEGMREHYSGEIPCQNRNHSRSHCYRGIPRRILSSALFHQSFPLSQIFKLSASYFSNAEGSGKIRKKAS